MTRGWQRLPGQAGLVLALAGAWLGLGVAGAFSAAAAQSCTGVTIAQGQGLTLDVSSVLVTTGGCVRFANLTSVNVTVSVSGSSFSTRVPARTPASASASYVAEKSATITATDGIRTGHGTITVEAPEPSPSAVTTFIPPPVSTTPSTQSTHTPKPPPTPTTSTSTPASSTSPSSAVSIPVLPSLPSGGSSGPPEASHPVVAPQINGSGSQQVVATRLDPVSNSHRGLPAAVGVVVVLGLATAFGRAVLAAAPAVDRRGRQVRLPL